MGQEESFGLSAYMDISNAVSNAKQWNRLVDSMDTTTKQSTKSMDKSFLGLGSGIAATISKFGFLMQGLQQLGGLVSKATNFAREAIDLGGDATEMVSKFGFTFGDETNRMTREILAFAEASGRSRYDLQGMAADFGAVLKGMGLAADETADYSLSLSKLAVDVGSFMNAQAPEVMQKFRAAMTGEYESLKSLGIVINEARVEQELLNMGIEGGKKAATAAQLVQARYNLIMQSTVDAQGDAVRTANSWANTQVNLNAVIRDFKTDMGLALTEAIGPVQRLLGQMAKATLPKLADAFSTKVAPGIASAVESILEFHDKLNAFFDAFRNEGDIFDVLQKGLQELGFSAKLATRIASIGDAIKNDIIPWVNNLLDRFSMESGASWAFYVMLDELQKLLSTKLPDSWIGVIDRISDAFYTFNKSRRLELSTGDATTNAASVLGLPRDMSESLGAFVDSVITGVPAAMDKIQAALNEGWSRLQAGIDVSKRTVEGGGTEGDAVTAFLYNLGLPGDISLTIGNWADGAIGAVQGAIEKVRTAIFSAKLSAAFGSDTGDVASSFLGSLGIPNSDGIGTAVQSIIETVQSGISDIGTAASEAFGLLQEGDLKGAFERLVDVPGAFLNMRAQVTTEAVGLGNELLTALGEAVPGLNPLVETLNGPVTDAFLTARDNLAEVKSKLTETFIDSIDKIQGGLLPELGETIASLAGNLTGLGDAITPALTDFLATTIPNVIDILSGAQPIIRDVGDLLETAGSTILPAVLDSVTKIVDKISEKMPELQELSSIVLPEISDTLEVLDPIIRGIGDALAWTVGALIDAALWIARADKKFKDLKLSSEPLLAVVQLLQKGADELVPKLEALADTFVTGAESWVTGILQGIGNTWDTIATWISEHISETVQPIVDQLDAWTTIGKDLIEGFKKGIGDAWGGVTAYIQEKINGIPEWIRKALGIGSPSKVMFEIGQYTSEGLAEGITEGGAGVADALMEISSYFMDFASSISDATAKRIKNVGSAFKDMGKGVDEIVGALSKLQDWGQESTGGAFSFPGMDIIMAAVDQFLAISEGMMVRIEEVISEIGYNRIHKLKLTARRLKEIVEAITIDMSGIKLADVPDIPTYFGQVFDVIHRSVAIAYEAQQKYGQGKLDIFAKIASSISQLYAIMSVELAKIVPSRDPLWAENLSLYFRQIMDIVNEILFYLGDMTYSVRSALAEAAKNAALIEQMYAVLISPADVIKPATGKNWAEDLALMMKQIGSIITETVSMLSGLSEETVQGVKDSVELSGNVESMVGFITPSIEILDGLSKYEKKIGLKESVKAFVDDLVIAITSIVSGSDEVEITGMAAAAGIYATIETLVGHIQPGLDLLVGLSAYVRANVDLKSLGKMIADDLLALAQGIQQADTSAITLDQATLDLWSLINTVAGTLKDAIDTINAVADWAPLANERDQIAKAWDIAVLIQALAAEMQAALGFIEFELSPTAADFYAAIDAVTGVLKNALDTITAVAGWEPLVNEADQVAKAWDISVLIQAIAEQMEAARDFVHFELSEGAELFWQSIQAVTSILTEAIGTLTALVDFRAYESVNYGGQAFTIAVLIQEVAYELEKARQMIAVDMSDDAAMFWDAIKGVIGIIEPAIAALAALAEYSSDVMLVDKINALTADLTAVVAQIQSMAQQWDVDAMSATATFSTAATNVVGVITPTVEAIASLGDLDEETNVVNKMATLKQQLGQIITDLVTMSQDYAESLPYVNQLVTLITRIADAVSGGVGVLEAMLEYRALSITQATAQFFWNLRRVQDAIVSGEQLMVSVMPIAESFQGMAKRVQTAIQGGFDMILSFAGIGPESYSWANVFTPLILSLSGVQDAMRSALFGFSSMFTEAQSSVGESAWNFGYSMGLQVVSGYKYALQSLPSLSAGAAASSAGNVSLSFGNVTISNGMEADAFFGQVRQVVIDVMRG